ncbi:2-hydroxyacid dehydrogenase [Xylophilus sp. Kf1]|nr:2-hydroxyacid dehydrogenase [Xylophilus sp. Kf1]
MRHKILVQQGAFLPQLEASLAAQYDVQLLPPAGDEREAFLAAHGQGIQALATSARFGVDAATIAALPDLKMISSFGVGLDALDLSAARARGIQVGYTPDVLNDCVADTAFALLMDVSRRITEADRFVRRGDWHQRQFTPARKVSGKRLGILGLGRIGSAIARRASGFDMEVKYHNRRPVEGSAYGYVDSLKALAEWADYLVIASAGGAETRGLVSAEVIDALGPDGYLINIARGTVVDEAALVAALSEKRLGGAGLDVFESEPRVPAELLALDNVVLLPHLASNTHETRAAMAQRVEDNLAAFFDGRPLVSAAF